MKKTVLSLALLALGCGVAVAQSAITPEVLAKMQQEIEQFSSLVFKI